MGAGSRLPSSKIAMHPRSTSSRRRAAPNPCERHQASRPAGAETARRASPRAGPARAAAAADLPGAGARERRRRWESRARRARPRRRRPAGRARGRAAAARDGRAHGGGAEAPFRAVYTGAPRRRCGRFDLAGRAVLRRLRPTAAVALLTAEPQPKRTAAPTFQVDPLWPKPLPNHWLFGSITGVAVDSRDHVWVVHRGGDSLEFANGDSGRHQSPDRRACCVPAPPVLEFDQAGALVGHWGGPGDGYDWPRTPGGIAVDAKGNVWIAAARMARDDGGPGDGAVGEAPRIPPAGRRARAQVHARWPNTAADRPGRQDRAATTAKPVCTVRPHSTSIGRRGSVRRGWLHNRRVVVFDAETGAYKRHWGAYGKRRATPTPAVRSNAPPLEQFRAVTCVASRTTASSTSAIAATIASRYFRKDGTFVKEAFVSKTTSGEGAVWDIAFSQRSAAALDLRRRRTRSEGVRASARDARRSCRASALAGAGRGPSSASAASPWIPRGTCSRARRSKASACRSSYRKGMSRDDQTEPR